MMQAALEIKGAGVGTSVATNGTWQKRGDSSLNGVLVATLTKGYMLLIC